jgi:hypothetical protein
MNKLPLAFSACVWLAACEPDFTPYNELEGMRVLLVRAEPPELGEGQTSTLDALVYQPEGKVPELGWSLCPWPSDPNDGFRCAVSQATWNAAWRAAGLSGSAPLLDLGNASTAALSFPGDRGQARRLCEALTRALDSSATLPPDCATRFPWTVRLTARSGTARVDAVKDVDLLIDEKLVPNRNPTLSALRSEGKGGSTILEPDAPTKLAAGEDHELRVEPASDALETYVPTPALGEPAKPADEESLTFTWFVNQGSTDLVRSTYKKGVETMQKATHNVWEAPDQTGDARLIVVVRDHRGGVGFLERTVSLVK